MTDHADVAAELREWLEAKTARYDAVRASSREQIEAVRAADTQELMRILGRKQAVIAEIEEMDRAAAPALARWEELRETADPDVRAPLEAARDALAAVLAEIVELEDEARGAVSGMSEEQGRRIARLQQGKRLHRAYGAPPPKPDSRFTDRKS